MPKELNNTFNFEIKDNYKELNIYSLFPTTIGVVDCPFYKEIKKPILNFFQITEEKDLGFVYWPIHLQKTPIFKKLNEWITEQVNIYSKIHKYNFEYEAGESWLIDYQNQSHNPWHKHNGWTISTNFFLLSNKNDSHTFFRSPVYGDMLNPQNTTPQDDGDNKKYNNLTCPTFSYAPIPGRLLIFRSHTEHMADLKKTKKRVIMSYNFNPKQKKAI